jgi:ABC-type transport system substrate-binding protein
MKGISMRRIVTMALAWLFLAATILGLPTAARAEGNALPEELMVANPNPTSGAFFADVFGTNGADIDVRALIHGYNLINWDQSQGTYAVDPSVVYAYTAEADARGNKTYTFTLWDDLLYSDGTKITAWDYAFSLLLQMSPEIEEIGGKIYRAEHILGNGDYLQGKTRALKGVRVLSDRELSITLDGAYLPFYYEEGLLLCQPYPMAVIAPGCKVYDDGEGAYIGGADDPEADAFTADLLQKTLLDPETGYNTHPSVTSGAYVLTGYDGTTCHFALNPNFKGVWIGSRSTAGMKAENVVRITDGSGKTETLVKPAIEKLGYTCVKSEEIEAKLNSGEIHLVNKVTSGAAIDDMTKSDRFLYDAYPRVGLSFLAFSAELPAVSEMAVRQAIAWCIDRDGITADYCGAYGQRVDGYFGMQRWEYLLAEDKIGYPLKKGYDTTTTVAEEDDGSSKYPNRYARTPAEYQQMESRWEELSLEKLTAYTVDTAKANALLNKAGWTLNQEGGKYRPDTEDIRSKRVNGELVALDLKLMYLEGSAIAESMERNAVENLKACGIRLTMVPATAKELLSSYYRETERTTEMLFLATNFNTVYDPAITVSTDTSANHKQWNMMYTDDAMLYKLAVDMRKTEPEDVYTYVQKWIAFEERYNQVLPAIPVYTNTYYDFFIPELFNYSASAHTTWAQAILESYLEAE